MFVVPGTEMNAFETELVVWVTRRTIREFGNASANACMSWSM